MKRYLSLIICCLFSSVLLAQAEQTKTDQSDEKVMYSLGYLLGNNVKKQLILEDEDSYKSFSQGMRDS